MFTTKNARAITVGAVLCVTLGAGATTALQASANAGPATPPTAPPPLRPKATAGATPQAQATNVHCGQIITASVILNGDLFCDGGTALTLSGSSVVLNLNGHELGGNGTGTGVMVIGKSDLVQNGLVTEFNLGVHVTGTNTTVSAVRATYNNGPGFFDEGTGTKLTNCFVALSASDGIVFAGSGAVYSGNHAVNNGNNGMILEGFDASVSSTIANGNTANGVDDLGYGTKLTKNTADFNGSDGIYSYDASLVDGGGNTAKGNERTTGPTAAVECVGVVCA